MLNQRKYLSKFSSALVIAGSIVGLSATELYAADTVMPKADISQTKNNIAALLPGSMLSLQLESIPTSYQHAGQRYVITYRSRGVNGEPIVTSGYILLPKGQAPKQGWPVLAWAHGTTGVADTCAPSSDYAGGPVHSLQEVIDGALDSWLMRGYAVIATDYQGLGTPGMHPYMNAASQVYNVVDSVRALHSWKPKQYSKDWVVMGHSQGGAAAIAVAAQGQKDAPELNLNAAIALAPDGYQYEGIAEYVQTNPNPDTNVAAFFPIVLLGAAAADPSINVDQLVSPDMQSLLNQARKRCLSELQTELKQAPQPIFKKDTDLKPLLSYLKRQSIEYMKPTVPLMFVQGTADHLVDHRGTQSYYQQVCKQKLPAVHHAIPNGDHRDALRHSPKYTAEFLKSLEHGSIAKACK